MEWQLHGPCLAEAESKPFHGKETKVSRGETSYFRGDEMFPHLTDLNQSGLVEHCSQVRDFAEGWRGLAQRQCLGDTRRTEEYGSLGPRKEYPLQRHGEAEAWKVV